MFEKHWEDSSIFDSSTRTTKIAANRNKKAEKKVSTLLQKFSLFLKKII